MKFYRYDMMRYTTGVQLTLIKFRLLKETPCGYWITMDFDTFYGWKKWIPKVSKKRYAYPTQQEALNSLIRRKELHLRYLKRDQQDINEVLQQALKIRLES